jgi:molybdenum cofactor biosynthesis protein B
MKLQPHPDSAEMTVICTVLSVSNTRSAETDKSGQLIHQLLLTANHIIDGYTIIKDETASGAVSWSAQIPKQIELLGKNANLDAFIFNNGTGIAPRYTSYNAI